MEATVTPPRPSIRNWRECSTSHPRMCDVHGLCASSPAKRRLFAQSHLHPDLLHFRFLSSPALTLDGLAKISALLAPTWLIRERHAITWAELPFLLLDERIIEMHIVLDGGYVLMPQQFL